MIVPYGYPPVKYAGDELLIVLGPEGPVPKGTAAVMARQCRAGADTSGVEA
jgi:hypothetical protein